MTVIATKLDILNPHDVAAFKPDEKLTLARRLCEFLNWAAVKHPLKTCPWNVATKAVMGYGRTPSMASKEVEHLRSCASRARETLMTKYRRDLVTLVGVGVRASTEGNDKFQTGMRKRARVLTRAAIGVERMASIIDMKELTPENRAGMNAILGVCKGLPALRERLMLVSGRKLPEPKP